MGKSNINRRYLRRRKSWIKRNAVPLTLWGIIILVLAACVLLVCMKAFSFGLFKNKSNSNASKEAEKQTEAAIKPENANWIETKIPEKTEVTYKAPEGVKYPYYIKVNRAMNCTTVYGIDSDGKYTIPVIAFATSCGRAGNETITGEDYVTTDKYEWRLMVDGTYGHYAFRINGSYLFHSVPFLSANSASLESEEFNKLGDYASLGCVRMCVRDVKWLYDNCESGTKVTIYDDPTTPGPLGKPATIKIPTSGAKAAWDPTDENPNNPWKDSKPEIKGAKDIVVKVGEKADLLKDITATDTCGNDISANVIAAGKYTYDIPGQYEITYFVRDAIDREAEVKVSLKVEK